MTTRYVGPGGSDGANGLSWANRKLTLAGVEATVAAGDTVYVAPGTYRETLTTAASGSNGSPITFVGDESGINTDGVGGKVRITGSDNDQTATRANGITCPHNFRAFRGFAIDTTTTLGISCTGDNLIVEQCSILFCPTGITISGAGQASNTVRRCLILGAAGCISISHTVTLSNVGHLIENCILLGMGGTGTSSVQTARVGGITVRNCLLSNNVGVRVNTALAAGQIITVNNCIIEACVTGVQGTALGEVVEDYNDFFRNAADRNTVNVGANSQNYTPLLAAPLLTLGVFTWLFGLLDSQSPLASIAGSGVASDDFWGTARVATSSWGPTQFVAGQRPVDAGQPRGRHALS